MGKVSWKARGPRRGGGIECYYLRVVDENVETAVGELLDLGLARRDALSARHVQLRGAQALRGQVLEDIGVARGGDDMASCSGGRGNSVITIGGDCCFDKRTLLVEFECQGVADASWRAPVNIVSASSADGTV